jgi:hypothetical protein
VDVASLFKFKDEDFKNLGIAKVGEGRRAGL